MHRKVEQEKMLWSCKIKFHKQADQQNEKYGYKIVCQEYSEKGGAYHFLL